jgi:hypothetical protein
MLCRGDEDSGAALDGGVARGDDRLIWFSILESSNRARVGIG